MHITLSAYDGVGGEQRGYMNKSISVKTAQVPVKKGRKKVKEKEEKAQLQARRRIVS